jgi:hypothetical protein
MALDNTRYQLTKAWSVRVICAAIYLGPWTPIKAAEPNESFGTASLLPAGVLIVADQLTPGQVQNPDTLLGIRNGSGVITQVNDNGSLAGNGFASGIQNAPTNGSSLAFSVTGAGDASFAGNHTQAGGYAVLVDVFSSSGSPLGTFTELRTLAAGQVHQFSISGNASWSGGFYSVNIDNLVSEPVGGDVDFFTFTGLPAGENFVAETFDPSSNVNTLVYWYNSLGVVLDTDDNSGVGAFSLIEGVVPANGRLTFAVTGFGDFVAGMPGGEHTQNGTYQMRVGFPNLLDADFNASRSVTSADLSIWKANYGQTIAADADSDYDTDGRDFLIWQRQVGRTTGVAAVTVVPEASPEALLVGAALCVLVAIRPSNWRGRNMDDVPATAHRTGNAAVVASASAER